MTRHHNARERGHPAIQPEGGTRIRNPVPGVSLWYFGESSCEACQLQFARLDDLQRDLETTSPGIGVQILGVNEFNEWTGVAEMTEGRLLPLLQDEPSVRVALLWGAVRRDLLVLDVRNEVIRRYNLDDYDIYDAGNYAELRQFLLDAAP